MAVLQARTRTQLRQSVGANLGAVRASTTTGAGSTTTLVDSSVGGGNDAHIGSYLYITGGTYAGSLMEVSDYTAGGTFTWVTALAGAPGSAVGYELWDNIHPRGFDLVTMIHEFINQALTKATGRFYDEEESLALCGDGEMARFDLPSEFAMLKEVWHRYYIEDKTVHEGTAAYDESVDADFTVTVDSEDKLGGESSIKFVVAGTASNGDIASDSISSLNLSGYTHIEFWIKVVTAVAANDLRYRLSATVNGGTETESLNIPALTALTKTKVRIALANPQSDAAIISVALEYNANVAANTIWISRVKAVRDNTALWEEIPRHLWYIDHEARDLILEWPAVARISDRLIKLKGGDKPAMLSADTGATEVPDDFIIGYATLKLEAALGKRDAMAADEWARAYPGFPSLDNVRTV